MRSLIRHRSSPGGDVAAAAALLIFAGTPGYAQSGPVSPRQADSVDYAFPDAPPNATTFDSKAFRLRIGFAVLLDYTFIGQDAASREQVGPQESTVDLRAGRLVLAGQFKFRRPWTYLLAGDVNEFREPQDQIFEGLDASVTIPLWKQARVTIGRQKEPFVYEMAGDAANLPQQERILSPFFTSRNLGIRYQDNYLNDRMSLNVGIYNNWLVDGLPLDESGTQVTGRVTGLPFMSPDTRHFLHLGVAVRYLGADESELRYKGRPESNATDNYVDTETFPARNAKHLAVEALYNTGSFSVLAEYVQAWVDVPSGANPSFGGYYVTGSYVLTGEHRPYDKRVGYARRVIPKSRWGAVELVGRFGYLDIDDQPQLGGKLAKWYAGVNWWASRQWKLGVGYGVAELDKLERTGQTQLLLMRMQWIY